MGQTIADLNDAEREWAAAGLRTAGGVAQSAGLAVTPGDVLAPDVLDTAWAAWLGGHARGQEDPNPYINGFGLAFGAYLVDQLGLEWKKATDEYGTEIAVWGREGDIVVLPTNLVGKRYAAGTQRFFADIASKMEDDIGRIRAGGQPTDAQPVDQPAKAGGLGRFLRRNR